MPKLLFQNFAYSILQEDSRMKRERYAFILVADKKYWNKLRERNKASGETHAFVRKNQVAPKTAQKLLFYVKKPVMQVQGIADFIERLTGDSGNFGENTVRKVVLKRSRSTVLLLKADRK